MSEPLPPPEAPSAPDTQRSWVTLFLTRAVLPVAFVVVALGCAGAMVMMRPSAAKGDVAASVSRVDVVTVQAGTTRAQVHSHGVVEAAQRVTVVPQVSAEVRWLSESVAPGGRLAAGEVYARLDARDYALAVEQARAQVESAKLEVELEKGRGRIAQKEWALLHPDRDPSDAPLALRGPQLNTAQQSLASAQATLEQAEVQLSRTRFTAPFDAMVVEESLEKGQVVAPGAPVATLIGTEAFWVTVSLPVSELGAVELPREQAPGSPAEVQLDLGSGQTVTRRGVVDRLLAQLDPQTRTAQLQVRIDDPLAGEGVPLLPGAFVDVRIEGRQLDGVVRVPRTAVHNGDTVWVVDGREGQGSLQRRTVSVGWKEGDDVLVTDGLASGDRVVVSPLSVPLEGTKVEVLSNRELPVDGVGR
jgi:RND family efflux transporter MFP subunit